MTGSVSFVSAEVKGSAVAFVPGSDSRREKLSFSEEYMLSSGDCPLCKMDGNIPEKKAAMQMVTRMATVIMMDERFLFLFTVCLS